MIRNILKIILGMTNPYKRNEKRVYKERQRAELYSWRERLLFDIYDEWFAHEPDAKIAPTKQNYGIEYIHKFLWTPEYTVYKLTAITNTKPLENPYANTKSIYVITNNHEKRFKVVEYGPYIVTDETQMDIDNVPHKLIKDIEPYSVNLWTYKWVPLDTMIPERRQSDWLTRIIEKRKDSQG